MDYFDIAKPTFLENWPKELCSFSIAQSGIKLSLDQAEALGTNIIELYECFPKPHFRCVDDIRDLIEPEIIKYPRGVFVRLGSRSPKDILYDAPLICFTASDVIKRLTSCSERIYEDLSMAIFKKYEPYIFMREWLDIPEWSEFRCFMKDKKLIGISQYNYLHEAVFTKILDNHEALKFGIELFFQDFKKAIHLDNVVFDVFVKHRNISGNNVFEIKLLEINPFFNLTDPCLFDWRKPEMFQGQFLFNK